MNLMKISLEDIGEIIVITEKVLNVCDILDNVDLDNTMLSVSADPVGIVHMAPNSLNGI
jgi:hypothetical protein